MRGGLGHYGLQRRILLRGERLEPVQNASRQSTLGVCKTGMSDCGSRGAVWRPIPLRRPGVDLIAWQMSTC